MARAKVVAFRKHSATAEKILAPRMAQCGLEDPTLTLSHIPVLVDHPTPGDMAMAESLMQDYAIES